MYALNILTTRKTYMQVTLRPVCSSFISCKAILYNYLLWHWAQLYSILSTVDQNMIPVFEIYSKYDSTASNIGEIHRITFNLYMLSKFHYNYLQYILLKLRWPISWVNADGAIKITSSHNTFCMIFMNTFEIWMYDSKTLESKRSNMWTVKVINNAIFCIPL